MRAKKFDCVHMKRLGAAQVQAQTATLTKEQGLAFWRERSQHLRWHQEGLAAHTSQADTRPRVRCASSRRP